MSNSLPSMGKPQPIRWLAVIEELIAKKNQFPIVKWEEVTELGQRVGLDREGTYTTPFKLSLLVVVLILISTI